VMKLIGRLHEAASESPSSEGETRGATRMWGAAETFFVPITQPFQAIARRIPAIEQSSRLRGRLLGSLGRHVSSGESGEQDGAADHPDEVLEGMNVFIAKKFPRASIEEIYECCLSDGIKTKSKPFFRPWLERLGATDVSVGDWMFAKNGEVFSDGWSGEPYAQHRMVTYCIERKPVVGNTTIACEVTQNQFCRFEGDDKKRLILQVSVETAGLPFGDTHTDMIRHVYTKNDDGSVSVKVGVFIMILKETMLSQKIRVEAMQAATKLQLELLRSIRGTLGEGTTDASVHEVVDVKGELDRLQRFRCLQFPLQSCLPQTQRMGLVDADELLKDVEPISEHLKGVETRLRAIEPLLEARAPDDDGEPWHFILSQFELVDEALGNIIQRHGDAMKGTQALDRASFALQTTL